MSLTKKRKLTENTPEGFDDEFWGAEFLQDSQKHGINFYALTNQQNLVVNQILSFVCARSFVGSKLIHVCGAAGSGKTLVGIRTLLDLCDDHRLLPAKIFQNRDHSLEIQCVKIFAGIVFCPVYLIDQWVACFKRYAKLESIDIEIIPIMMDNGHDNETLAKAKAPMKSIVICPLEKCNGFERINFKKNFFNTAIVDEIQILSKDVGQDLIEFLERFGGQTIILSAQQLYKRNFRPEVFVLKSSIEASIPICHLSVACEDQNIIETLSSEQFDEYALKSTLSARKIYLQKLFDDKSKPLETQLADMRIKNVDCEEIESVKTQLQAVQTFFTNQLERLSNSCNVCLRSEDEIKSEDPGDTLISTSCCSHTLCTFCSRKMLIEKCPLCRDVHFWVPTANEICFRCDKLQRLFQIIQNEITNNRKKIIVGFSIINNDCLNFLKTNFATNFQICTNSTTLDNTKPYLFCCTQNFVGVNLTTCTSIILFNTSTLAQENQIMRRAVRPGNLNESVYIYKIVLSSDMSNSNNLSKAFFKVKRFCAIKRLAKEQVLENIPHLANHIYDYLQSKTFTTLVNVPEWIELICTHWIRRIAVDTLKLSDFDTHFAVLKDHLFEYQEPRYTEYFDKILVVQETRNDFRRLTEKSDILIHIKTNSILIEDNFVDINGNVVDVGFVWFANQSNANLILDKFGGMFKVICANARAALELANQHRRPYQHLIIYKMCIA